MREDLLRDYFTGSATAAALSRDLEDSMVSSSSQVIEHPIVDMQGEFEVRCGHLVRLCGDVLDGHIDPWQLQPIAFCLVASDAFWWDGDTPDGARVAETVGEWSSPEINWRLTSTTVGKFRHRLLTGERLFGRADGGSG